MSMLFCFEGKENGRLLNSSALEKVLQIMNDFDDIDIHISGCKIMAHIAIRKYFYTCKRYDVVFPPFLGVANE